MLKTRVISAVIGLLLLAIVIWLGKYALGIAVFALALFGLYEFYKAVENAGYKPLKIVGYLSSLAILFIGLNGSIDIVGIYFDLFKSVAYFSFALFIAVVILFSFIIFLHDRYNVIDIALTIFGSFYVVFLFSFIVLTRNMNNGFYLVGFIFIGGWGPDTFAYFSGKLFGKTKLLPAISPKKTVEGSVGGIIGCVAITLLYGLFINSLDIWGSIPVIHFIIIGILGGILSQIGDLSASAIKRYVKIKDYGNIMPGHGGILDRFDSILFVAPMVYFYVSFIIFKT